MKKLTIALAALLISAAAYGQGTVTINNLLNKNRFILTGVDPADGTASSVGTDFSVSLLGGPVGASGATLVALEPASTTFRGAAGSNAAGYLNAVTAKVPNVAPGGNADIVLRLTGAKIDQTDLRYTVNALGGDPGTGAPPLTPPNLNFGAPNTAIGLTPTNVPEPTTLALGVLGIGTVLFLRRRK